MISQSCVRRMGAALLPVVAGAALSSAESADVSIVGLAVVFLCNIFFALRSIVTKRIKVCVFVIIKMHAWCVYIYTRACARACACVCLCARAFTKVLSTLIRYRTCTHLRRSLSLSRITSSPCTLFRVRFVYGLVLYRKYITSLTFVILPQVGVPRGRVQPLPADFGRWSRRSNKKILKSQCIEALLSEYTRAIGV